MEVFEFCRGPVQRCRLDLHIGLLLDRLILVQVTQLRASSVAELQSEASIHKVPGTSSGWMPKIQRRGHNAIFS